MEEGREGGDRVEEEAPGFVGGEGVGKGDPTGASTRARGRGRGRGSGDTRPGHSFRLVVQTNEHINDGPVRDVVLPPSLNPPHFPDDLDDPVNRDESDVVLPPRAVVATPRLDGVDPGPVDVPLRGAVAAGALVERVARVAEGAGVLGVGEAGGGGEGEGAEDGGTGEGEGGGGEGGGEGGAGTEDVGEDLGVGGDGEV